jgi:hypothetical protein
LRLAWPAEKTLLIAGLRQHADDPPPRRQLKASIMHFWLRLLTIGSAFPGN